MIRTVNLRAIVITLVIASLFIGGSVVLHQLQVDRQADAFLAQAHRLLAQENEAAAIGYYRNYLRLNPDDVETMAEFGNLLADAGRLGEAQTVLGQVVQRDGSREAERKRLVEVAIGRGRFQDALFHLNEHLIDPDLVDRIGRAEADATPLEPDPQVAELLHLKGICEGGLGDYDQAEATFAIAMKADPNRLETVETLAELRVDNRRPRQQFDAAIDDLDQTVKTHPDRYEAYVIRGQFFQRHRDEPAVHAHVAKKKRPNGDDDAPGEVETNSPIQQQIDDDAQRAPELPSEEFRTAEADLADTEAVADDDSPIKQLKQQIHNDAQRALELSLEEFIAAKADLADAEAAAVAKKEEFERLTERDHPDPEQLADAGVRLWKARHELSLAEREVFRLQAIKLFAATAALSDGKLDLADRLAQELIEAEASFASPTPYVIRADIASQSERLSEAIGILTEGLERFPKAEELLWSLASIRISKDEFDAAGLLIERLGEISGMQPLVRFLEAEIALQKRNWDSALAALESVRPNLGQWPEIAKRADLFLGHCYGGLGEIKTQIEFYERARRADRWWIDASLHLAAAYHADRQYDRAHDLYETALRLESQRPQVHLQFVRAWINKKTSAEGSLREEGWAEIADYLERMRPQIEGMSTDDELHASERKDLELEHSRLTAFVQLARGDLDAARQTLTRIRDLYPDEVSTWANLISLEQRDRNDAEVDRLLAEAREQFGDREVVDLRIIEAQVAFARQAEDVEATFEKLAELPEDETFAADDRERLTGTLAVLALRVGAFDLAESLCHRFAELQPDNLEVHLLLFDLALRSERTEDMESVLVDVDRIDGRGYTWHYGQAVVDIVNARQIKDSSGKVGNEIEELCNSAEVHLQNADELRQDSPAVARLRGEVESIRNNKFGAIECYRQAIELGDSNPELIGRVVALLHEAGRYREADEELARLERQTIPFSNQFGRLAADVSYHAENYVNAARYALQAAHESEEYDVLVWAGQIAGRSDNEGDKNEAEQTLRTALELSPQQPGAWLTLIQFHLRQGQTESALTLLEEASAAIAEEDRSLALAQAHELFAYYQQDRQQHLEQAEAHYVQAVQSETVRPTALNQAARFYRDLGRTDEAEPLLRRLLSPEFAEALDGELNLQQIRRDLGVILVARGRYASLIEAGELAQANLADSPDAPEAADRRLLALSYLGRPEQDLRPKAIEEFEAIVGTRDETIEDKYLLAKLYLSSEEVNVRKEARKMLLEVASSPDATPQHVRAHISLLLEGGEPGEARFWIERLIRMETKEARKNGTEEDAPSVGTLLLLVQALSQIDHFDAARQAVETRIVDPDARNPAGRHVLAAAQLVSIADRMQAADSDQAAEVTARAEELLTDSLVQESDLALEYAIYLARRDRLPEALDHIALKASEVPDFQLARSAETLMLKIKDSGQLERLESILLEALQQQPDSLAIRLAAADIQNWLGRYAEAEANYRLVLEQAPESVNALNNLAFLLAIQNGDLEEADQLVKKSLDLMGPQPALLDSYALVLMAKQHYAHAESILEEAIAAAPGNALYLMHQAEAKFALRRDEAEVAELLQQAEQFGVANLPLHPSDRQRLQQLESKL